jgi:drug/metabolite transporter (DMT)-like permease
MFIAGVLNISSMDLSKYAAPILLFGMLLACFIAVFSRGLMAAGLSVMDVTFLRLSIAFAGLFVLMLLIHRSWDCFRLNVRDLPLFILFGIFKILSDFSFIHALDNISVCLATLLQNTAPYFVMILSYYIFRTRVSRKILMLIMLGTFGCVLMSGMALLHTNLEPLGIISALVSALCLSTFYIGTAVTEMKGYTPGTFSFYVILLSALVSLPFIDAAGIGVALSDPINIYRAVALGLVSTLIPTYIMAWSVKYLNPLISVAVCVSEIAFAALVGAVFFNEALDIFDCIGMVLMMASIILISRQSAIEKRDVASEE